MRRIALISWIVIVMATIGGGVWAAQRMAKPCTTAALPTQAHLASLQPVEEFPWAAGRIVAIDAKDGRVTVRHRGIDRFYLEPGTYIFHVDDRSLLTGLTPGDKIRFDVAREGRHFTITHLANSN